MKVNFQNANGYFALWDGSNFHTEDGAYDDSDEYFEDATEIIFCPVG
jgi:hypothetical protein